MRVIVAGAGIGGLTTALCLRRAGHDVELIERASEFGEVGAGVALSPNAVRVLEDLELGEPLADVGISPAQLQIRRWVDDAVLLDNPMGDAARDRYGSPMYNVYRPDLVGILAAAAADIPVRFRAQVVGASSAANGASVQLADGTRVEGDLLVGADGVHSAVRTAVFGPETTRFSRFVAYRALVPAALVPDLPTVVTIRVGPERHFVTYFIGEGKQFLNIVGVVPEDHWEVESWTEPGELSELQAEFADWSPVVADILSKVDRPVFRWALHDREELPNWTTDNVALVGDACHPMLPFMGQGAGQAIEDAIVLTNAIAREDDLGAGLADYEAVRKPRATQIQNVSWDNRVTYHLPDGPDQETRDLIYRSATVEQGMSIMDWIYGHNALSD